MAEDGFGFFDVAGFVSDEVLERDLEGDVAEGFGVLQALRVAADRLALHGQDALEHGAIAVGQGHVGGDGGRLAAERDDLVGQVGRVDLLAADFGREELRQLRAVRTINAGGVGDVGDDRGQLRREVDR